MDFWKRPDVMSCPSNQQRVSGLFNPTFQSPTQMMSPERCQQDYRMRQQQESNMSGQMPNTHFNMNQQQTFQSPGILKGQRFNWTSDGNVFMVCETQAVVNTQQNVPSLQTTSQLLSPHVFQWHQKQQTPQQQSVTDTKTNQTAGINRSPTPENKTTTDIYAPHIVIGPPAKILAAVRSKKLSLKHLKHFILDECDKMLEQLDMRRDVQEIFKATPHEKQVMMFSATLSKDIRPVLKKFLQDSKESDVNEDANLTLHKLQQNYMKLKDTEKNRMLFELLEFLEFNQMVIFVKSVQTCIALAALLEDRNYTAIAIHRAMDHKERLSRYQLFKDFNKRILVATNLFGREMDIDRVNIVILYDMPDDDASGHQSGVIRNTPERITSNDSTYDGSFRDSVTHQRLFSTPSSQYKCRPEFTLDDSGSPRLTPTGRQQVMNRLAKADITYEGNPDEQPIRTFESAVLVHFLLRISKMINEKFGEFFRGNYFNHSIWGGFLRSFLSAPVTYIHVIKREGEPPKRETETLPPRVNLRILGRYSSIYALIFLMIFSKIIGIPMIHLFSFLFLIFFFSSIITAIINGSFFSP